jgi:hypothetical protein
VISSPFIYCLFLLLISFSHAQAQTDSMNLVKISQSFLSVVRTGDSSNQYVLELEKAAPAQLQRLTNDADKKAFWLNIYNGFVQKVLSENPGKYKNRNSFFSSKQITIAGKQLSLDDIEHGLLRRSKIKWSLGYLNKLFPSSFEKTTRVGKLDNRIHFALNCGAKSCPPIAFYEPAKIDMQLELATKTYLHSEVEYDHDSSAIFLPKIMSWFRGDFEGKKGTRKFLQQYQVEHADAKIKFKDYDWNLYLANYKRE